MADYRLVCLSMGKFVFIIISKVSRLSESYFSVYNFNHLKNKLALFSIQYSKTESSVRSLASSLDYRSLEQGVHHTIVAVELWLQLLLKKLRLAMFFHIRQSYDIITFPIPLAECSSSCCWLIGATVSLEISLTLAVHHTLVAAKVAFVIDLFNLNTTFNLNLAEYSQICFCLGASFSLEKSSAISLEKMDNSINVQGRQVDKRMKELKKMKPNFLLHVGMFQQYKQRGLSLVSKNW